MTKLLIAVLLVACGGRSEPMRPAAPVKPEHVQVDAPPAPVPDVVGLALDVLPAAAHVMIDDVDHGAASGLAAVVPLEPGLHYVVITHERYRPFRVEFAVSDKTERMTVRLELAR